MKFYEILKTSLFRALCALRALRAWRVHVLGVLECFRCSSAWSALRNNVPDGIVCAMNFACF